MSSQIKIKIFVVAVLLISVGFFVEPFNAINAKTFDFSMSDDPIEITPNFTGRDVAPNEKIELRLSRALKPEEGSLAVVLNETDLTALVVAEPNVLTYMPKFLPLPSGENKLAVYSVSSAGEWTLLKEFPLRVAEKKETEAEVKTKKEEDETKVEFTPVLNLNVQGESNVLFFPEGARPERLRYADTTGQGGFQLRVLKKGWTLGAQFDFAGATRRAQYLRFGELGNEALPIDLSSYQVELSKGRFKVQLGHVSFGSQRYLINSFSSRGLVVTVPVSKQDEVSFTMVNGTSVVGFDNFTGLSRARHQVFAVTFAREFIKERPGALRLEVTGMRGSLLPLNGVNEREVKDAEKSFGGAIRLQFRDKKERLRVEAGYTRSRFTNPSDPTLEQGFPVVQVLATTRNARFLEASFDFLQGLKLFDDRKLKVTGTFRHEEIEPLFRSVVASNQADRRQNQFEVTAAFGDINFTYGNLRDRDNLNDILSILKTLTRRNNMIFSASLGTLFTPSKPISWLPRISYAFDHTHQFGVLFPTGGGFDNPSQVPDQDTFNHSFNAEWQFTEKFRLGYRYNRAFQDNKQVGRALADFSSAVNAFTIGFNYFKNVDLGFDLSQERQKNFETGRIDRQFRFGTNMTWREAVLKNSTVNANFSTALAGDRANAGDARNLEFDVQWAYRFSFGKEKYKKLGAQFFVRYANRYGERRDNIFFLNDLNKSQGFNAGISFSFF